MSAETIIEEIPVADDVTAHSENPNVIETEPSDFAGYSAAMDTPEQALQQKKESDSLISGIAAALILFGVIGCFTSSLSIMGNSPSASVEAARALGIPDSVNPQAEIYERTIALQEQFATVIFMHKGICIFVGLGLAFAGVMLKLRCKDAHSIASTASIAAIFGSVLTFVVTWITTPVWDGIAGLPEGTGSSMIAGAAAGMLIKCCGFGFAVFYLSSNGVKAIFAAKEN